MPGGRCRSILPGHKRTVRRAGQACVSALAHQTGQTAGQTPTTTAARKAKGRRCANFWLKEAYTVRREPHRRTGYSLPPDAPAPRLRKAGIGTLVVVSRSRKKLNGSQQSQEDCYYVSNARPADQAGAEELFDAIRGHWVVEPGRRSSNAPPKGCNAGGR